MSNQNPVLYGEYEDHVLGILHTFGVNQSAHDPLDDRAFGEVCLYLMTHQVEIVTEYSTTRDEVDPRANPDVIYALYHFACWNSPLDDVGQKMRRLEVLQLRRRRN